METEAVDRLARKLIRTFVLLLLPALALFVLAYATQHSGLRVASPGNPRAWGIVLLLLTVILSVALPILLRTVFHDRAARRGRVEYRHYERFQVRQMAVTLAGAVFAGLAYLLLVPRFHLYASVLMALYGIYSVLPARRKLAGEMKYYKIPG
jgi:hypothetical protein